MAAGAAPQGGAGAGDRGSDVVLLGVSTRRVEKLAESLGVTKLSKSQVSVMAAELDEMMSGSGPGRWTLARTRSVRRHADWKVREGGRTVNVHALIATGVNADGKGDPGRGRRHRRGRCGVDGVPAWPSCPRAVRRAAGHLGLPPRAA